MNTRIAYREGYKYQLAETYTIHTPVMPQKQIVTDFVKLTRGGLLTIKKDYAWDGASGPTFDTKASMRPSLVHDALYSLMRDGLLPFDQWRLVADKLFYDLCRQDGMWPPRASIWYAGVRVWGGHHPDDRNTNPVLYAP